jgi:hypothetical protein
MLSHVTGVRKTFVNAPRSCSGEFVISPSTLQTARMSNKPDTLCEQCSRWDFAEFFLWPAWLSQAQAPLGSSISYWDARALEALQRNKFCPFCRLVVQIISKDPAYNLLPDDIRVGFTRDIFGRCEPIASSPPGSSYYTNRIGIEIIVINPEKYGITSPTPNYVVKRSIQVGAGNLSSANSSPTFLLQGRPIQSQVDTALLNSWLDRCNLHGQGCRPDSSSNAFAGGPDFRFIDLNSDSITSTTVQPERFATGE